MMATSRLALTEAPDSPKVSMANNRQDQDADLYSHIKDSRLYRGDQEDDEYSKKVSIPNAVVVQNSNEQPQEPLAQASPSKSIRLANRSNLS